MINTGKEAMQEFIDTATKNLVEVQVNKGKEIYDLPDNLRDRFVALSSSHYLIDESVKHVQALLLCLESLMAPEAELIRNAFNLFITRINEEEPQKKDQLWDEVKEHLMLDKNKAWSVDYITSKVIETEHKKSAPDIADVLRKMGMSR